MHDLRARRRIGPAADGSLELLAALDDVTAFGMAPAYRRRQIERTVDALLMILDAMDGDPDREPEEDRGELDYLPDDDSEPVHECMSVVVLSARRVEGVQHG